MPFFAKPTTQQIKWESQRPPVPPVCICNFGRFNTWEELEEGVWICVWHFLQTEVFTLIALIALKPLGAQMWNIGRIFLLATQIQRPNIYLCTDIALLRKGSGKDGRPWICANKIKSIKVFFLDFEPINSGPHLITVLPNLPIGLIHVWYLSEKVHNVIKKLYFVFFYILSVRKLRHRWGFTVQTIQVWE